MQNLVFKSGVPLSAAVPDPWTSFEHVREDW